MVHIILAIHGHGRDLRDFAELERVSSPAPDAAMVDMAWPILGDLLMPTAIVSTRP